MHLTTDNSTDNLYAGERLSAQWPVAGRQSSAKIRCESEMTKSENVAPNDPVSKPFFAPLKAETRQMPSVFRETVDASSQFWSPGPSRAPRNTRREPNSYPCNISTKTPVTQTAKPSVAERLPSSGGLSRARGQWAGILGWRAVFLGGGAFFEQILPFKFACFCHVETRHRTRSSN